MIEADALAKIDGVRHGFFTREGGYSRGLYSSLNCGLGSGDDQETVRRNREKVASSVGVEGDRLITLYQHHSADTLTVDAPWGTLQRPKADAMVTDKPGLALGVLTADCGPVLFCDPVKRVIGAAHAGWKGALAGITDGTLSAMDRLGARRENVIAVVGPSISQASYEVGPDFRARFESEDPENARWFLPSINPGHAMFDLPGYLVARLTKAGVGKVVNLELCTYADPQRFFSYRRTTHSNEADYGRQISAISLAD